MLRVFYPVEGNRWKRGEELYLPLYQGRMIWHFDHRANSVLVNPESAHNPYLSEEVSEAQHADPNFLPQTQYWVPSENVETTLSQSRRYTLGFRDITNPTNERTSVASIVPWAGYGNTVPVLLGNSAMTYAYLVANLNAICMDFVARQKAQGTHLNWYIVEQLPVIAPDDYDRQFGDTTAREIVRKHVLELTYTAHDMEPFARDLGYEGPPFIWDEEDRRHLRARLDALYFHLYGLSREDAAYVMDTFPIVRREDEARFGRYRTREMVLAYMNALSSGDGGGAGGGVGGSGGLGRKTQKDKEDNTLRLKKVTIKDFKRFTDLTVRCIPKTTRLIVARWSEWKRQVLIL